MHTHVGPTDVVAERSAAVDPRLSSAELAHLLSEDRAVPLGAVRLVIPRGRYRSVESRGQPHRRLGRSHHPHRKPRNGRSRCTPGAGNNPNTTFLRVFPRRAPSRHSTAFRIAPVAGHHRSPRMRSRRAGSRDPHRPARRPGTVDTPSRSSHDWESTYW
jgi:hypothetical protein